MSKTSTALLMKFIFTFIAAWIAFAWFDNNALGFIFMVALAGTILNYLIGDLFILPSFGNMIAAIADGGLAVLTAYLMGMYIYGYTSTTTAYIAFGIIVAIVELFFHMYLLRTDEVAPNVEEAPHHDHNKFKVEAGEEIDIDRHKVNKKLDKDNPKDTMSNVANMGNIGRMINAEIIDDATKPDEDEI